MLPNEKFVRSKIISILEGVCNIFDSSCKGIEGFPLSDYVFQSTLLKMSGYLEQKIKCICYDLGCVDYELRYEILDKWKNWGTFSSYDKIKQVYDLINKSIKNYDSSYNENTGISKDSYQSVKDILEASGLRFYNEKGFLNFKNDAIFFNSKKISDNGLVNIYKSFYNLRNSIAHNTKSYQQELPKLSELKDKDKRDNFYYFFTVLVIYDNYFVQLYDKYAKCISNAW